MEYVLTQPNNFFFFWIFSFELYVLPKWTNSIYVIAVVYGVFDIVCVSTYIYIHIFICISYLWLIKKKNYLIFYFYFFVPFVFVGRPGKHRLFGFVAAIKYICLYYYFYGDIWKFDVRAKFEFLIRRLSLILFWIFFTSPRRTNQRHGGLFFVLSRASSRNDIIEYQK